MVKAKKSPLDAFLITPAPVSTEMESTASEKHLEKIIDEIYSTEDIELKTDLNPTQIVAITKGQLFAEQFNNSLMADLCNRLMILSVSKGRMGRKEFTEISKSMHPTNMLPEEPTLKSRLLGQE